MLNLEIPAAWDRSATEIVQHRWRKVLVIGAVDRGKSTYCGFLSQRLLAAGCRVAVVDADVGQKDIGPPATITLGYPYPSRALTEVQPVGLYFVGAVSPARHLLPMVIGTRQLVDAAQAAFVLINTTGFVHGPGHALKAYTIEAIQPDVVVALDPGAELQAIVRAYRNYRMRCLRPAASAITKTPEQRREARERAFRRYFQGATEIILPCRRLIFQRTPGLPGFDQNLLCGIAGRRNKGLGLAIVTHRDMSRDTITLLTPVPAERIRIIQYGDLYLSLDGRELGRR
jgi:polynucleotide 5'-hydroxyl-kinase GRC3/NOL9